MVSILMPVFNAAPYLKECIDSILAQSHADWELIAIEDQSEDESLAILKAFAQSEERISCYQNKQKGIISALRLAYSKCSGDLITRMDADDIMPEHKLELMSQACKANTVVTGYVEYFRSDGELGDGYKRYTEWLNGLVDAESHWQEIYKECVIPSPAWMMSRKSFENIGAFSADVYPEDYELVFRMYAAGLQVIALASIVHLWRDHSSRASRNDPNYEDNLFLDLKLDRFTALELKNNRPLALWGAGNKGKYCARYFIEHNIPFTWHTDNPKKQGRDIYGEIVQAPNLIPMTAITLLTMASPQQQIEVKRFLSDRTAVKGVWIA